MIKVHTFEEAQEILQGEEVVSLDLETGGFSPWQSPIHVIGMYGRKSRTPVVLHYPRGRVVPLKVLRWLETFPEIVTHNGTMFDILFLANAGMAWDKVKWYDTLIGELAVITSSRRNVRVNLKDSLKRRTGKVISKDINHESWGNAQLDAEQLRYLEGDISSLLELQDEQFSRAAGHADMLRNLDFEMSIIPAVVQMELNGLPIDVDLLHQFLKVQEKKADETEEKIFALLGGPILLSSPIQIKRRLQSMFGEGMFASTAAETLLEYKIFGGQIGEICELLLDYRHADRREKMYSPKWQQENIITHDGFSDTRVHGKFWQIGTETGRFSSSNPNLQQIPRDMREIFRIREGRSIGATDYSGIEVRVAASLADDRVMMGVFESGGDIHRAVASAGFSKPESEVTDDERQIAKAMSFTLLFGGGADTFRSYATARGADLTIEMAELAVERFFEQFEGLARMRESANWKAQNMKNVTLVYPTGLKRVLFNESLRASVILNNIVQGTAAAGLKYALQECLKSGLAQYLSAVVHDEIVYTASDSEIIGVRDAIEDCMIVGMQRALVESSPVPVEVESKHGRSWEGPKSSVHTRVG